ncbi:hypothetical protein BZG35_07995 [Brevundimonas sp. LM2]|uniref:hypothetical protein n=1 Tax=Brevundimonas sp. LM2 TaxID=1938605 RepID=UPI000983912C|nr:hypothetical protein [Brevundimonas sp. LM2]AQR61599.1 hypothetical protein BZG35_07995 [Brevundimonas sp. LM2]
MAARLKVFTWSDGFHAFTVAASSRPKALEAWGLTGDIFKTGLAKEASADGPDNAAALASPGSVVTRGLAVDIGETSRRKAPARKVVSEKARRRVTDLEARLEALDGEQTKAREALEARRAALDQAQADLQRDQAAARAGLERQLKTARAAIR